MVRIDKIEFEQRKASLTHIIVKEFLKVDGLELLEYK